MSNNLNPQREQMADESMVRGLRAQADAIWPGESELPRNAQNKAVEMPAARTDHGAVGFHGDNITHVGYVAAD